MTLRAALSRLGSSLRVLPCLSLFLTAARGQGGTQRLRYNLIAVLGGKEGAILRKLINPIFKSGSRAVVSTEKIRVWCREAAIGMRTVAVK